MKNNLIISYILTLSLLYSGCSNKRKCIDKNSHDGLYNALTCDYQANIEKLEFTLSEKIIIKTQLFYNYQRLIAEVTNKQERINVLNQEILNIDKEINAIQLLVQSVHKSEIKGLTVLKLKSRLRQLNMNILNKSTFFDIKDALFTNKKLLVSNDKQKYAQAYDKNLLNNKEYALAYNKDLLKDQKYAQAYDKNLLSKQKYAQAYHKNLLQDKKYAQAYNEAPNVTFTKAYNTDIDQDKKLRESFSSQIESIRNSLNSANLSASEKNIESLMKNIEKYNNSQKKS